MYVTPYSARFADCCKSGYKNTVNAAGGVSAVADKNVRIPLWRVVLGSAGFSDLKWILSHNGVFFVKDEWFRVRDRMRLDLVSLMALALVEGRAKDGGLDKPKKKLLGEARRQMQAGERSVEQTIMDRLRATVAQLGGSVLDNSIVASPSTSDLSDEGETEDDDLPLRDSRRDRSVRNRPPGRRGRDRANTTTDDVRTVTAAPVIVTGPYQANLATVGVPAFGSTAFKPPYRLDFSGGVDDNDGIHRNEDGALKRGFSGVRDRLVTSDLFSKVLSVIEKRLVKTSDKSYIDDIVQAEKKVKIAAAQAATYPGSMGSSSRRKLRSAKIDLYDLKKKQAEAVQQTMSLQHMSELATIRDLVARIRETYPFLTPEQRVECWRKFVAELEENGINTLMLFNKVGRNDDPDDLNEEDDEDTNLDCNPRHFISTLFSDRDPDWTTVTQVLHFVCTFLGRLTEGKRQSFNTIGIQYFMRWFDVPPAAMAAATLAMMSKTKFKTEVDDEANSIKMSFGDSESMVMFALGIWQTCNALVMHLSDIDDITLHVTTQVPPQGKDEGRALAKMHLLLGGVPTLVGGTDLEEPEATVDAKTKSPKRRLRTHAHAQAAE